ncbi:helix-turn-helix domain-containing protein [Mucilaginibacter aquariorum]|uniref:AraC family transcriptional regulator n=1 Tax=Mucilaginibacter aquariorum TaxID=2967225 RepID=A0ABT1SW01_9SPHI|nr:AraC family transcriptional regulator [Mucilaginibacter aquariorum]MCQ6956437.1 AraC family transcriptional regulator [Mucilaginibacter aquariorum]
MEKIPIRHINTTREEPTLSGSFSIRDVRNLLDGKDMVQELHRHDFYYLLVLENGAGNHNIDFSPYSITDHTVFFMRPGQVHQLVLEAESTGYLLQFKGEFYSPKNKVSNQLLRKASHTHHYQFDADGFKRLLSILTYIFQESIDKNERFEEVIKANLDILFIELIRRQGSTPTAKVSLYLQERLDKFFELLETHILTHKQVARYAEMLNLSAYQLNATAKAALGKTCSELINEQIILEAKRCLLATSNQINQTAYRLGYEDVSYFIRFFKKHTGYSPEAFRNNFR